MFLISIKRGKYILKKEKKVIFIIVEPHMENQLNYLEKLFKKNNIKIHKIKFPRIEFNDGNILNLLFKRVLYGKKYLSEVKKIIGKNKDIINNNTIIFSCGEGFIIGNINYWFPSFNNKNTIAIQHGMFLLKSNNILSIFKKSFNLISKILFGINLIGKGFGGTKFGNYIVYGVKYKNYLLEKGWENNDILVSGNLIKGNYLNEKYNNNCKQKMNSVVLLLQDLTVKNISFKKFENYLFKIIEILSDQFSKVIVRLHPKMDKDFISEIENKTSKNEIIFSSKRNLIDDFNQSDCAISFFSTALIDANLFGLPVAGIKLPEIKLEYYQFLNKIIKLENLKSEIIELKKNMKVNSWGIKQEEFTVNTSGLSKLLKDII